jgi:GMP synthase (glutamine-hydrolysing)
MARHYGGTVEPGEVGEFGIAQMKQANDAACPLFRGIELPAQVWMSHQDAVTSLPAGFCTAASTGDCVNAAIQCLEKRRFGLQFHVEVKDTPCGNSILENFARFCGMEKNWDQDAVFDHIVAGIRREAAGKKVLLFLSGGVDSTVAFALLNQALGQERVLGLHIDNGFMRKNESSIISRRYRRLGFTNFVVEDASERFLAAVAGISDPQDKRRAVGETFIAVRDAVAARLNMDESQWLLAQGTLYPDIIESGGTENARVIKTHHNRVAGIQALLARGLIIEPLKDLYKDEVRLLGAKLGLSSELVQRHPFPGPGLSINVLCSTGSAPGDAADLERLRAALTANAALPRLAPGAEIASPADRRSDIPAGFRLNVLPVRSVGVQGDFRTYTFPAVLTPVVRTAAGEAPVLDWDALECCSAALTNAVKGVNRVVLELWCRNGAVLRLQKGFCDKARLDQTREVDAVVLEELKRTGWYSRIFQHLTINLPWAGQADHCAMVLRPVVSEDVMTARFARLDTEVLTAIRDKITALGFVDALYYDVTNKPPATFGWE